MLYGQMVGERVLIVGEGEGLPVVEADAPEAVQDGWRAVSRWASDGRAIRQSWSVEPAEGTAADAAVALARMQAAALPDEDAVKVVALYPEWTPSAPQYAKGERVRWGGLLYRCLSGHGPQADWEPGKAPSLWARVLPGQDGTVGEWVQPADATTAYKKGDRVTHKGKTWVSDIDANVWEPGTENGGWTEVAEGGAA